MGSEKSKVLRSWDDFDTALDTDLLSQSTNFKFEDLDKNLENFNINNIEKPKNLKKSSQKTITSDSYEKNVISSELLNQKNTKSKKQTKAQLKTNSTAKSKKATKKNSAKKVEPEVTQRSLKAEQKIAPNSPTVVPTPETLTPVEQSNLPLPLTTQTQTTLPAQPNLDSTSTSTSVQNPPVLPTVTSSHISDESKPASTPEQKIASDSPTVVPTPETLTPVEQSNLPLPLTTQTQTTLPAQPNVESTSTETSQQIPPVTPTLITPDVNNKSEPTLISSASTTAPPTLGNESTLMRQSLNQEQGIAPDSPTVVPTPETLTPVEQSNLPLPLTTQTQTTLPAQPNLDSTSTSTSVQNPPVLPTVTSSHISDESKPASTPEQKIASDSPTVVPTPETLTPVEQSNLPLPLTTQTQTTLPAQPNLDSTSTETSQQIPPVTPTLITPDVNNKSEPTPISSASTTASPTLGEQPTLMRQSLKAEQKIAPNSPTVVPTPETLTPVEQSNLPLHLTTQTQTTHSSQPSLSDLPLHLTTQTQTTLRAQPNVDSTSTSTSVQNPPVLPTVTSSHVGEESKPASTPEQKIASDSPTVVPTPETLTPVEQSNLPLPLTTQTQTTLPAQPNVESTSTETSQQIPPVTPTLITPDVNNKSEPTLISSASTTAPPTLGNESTLMRQSLNQEQGIAPDSPTVVPTPETLTPVKQSNLPLHLTTQTQTTLRAQPNLDSTSTSTSVQNPPVLPTVTSSHISDESKPASTPEQKIASDSPTVVPTPETLTPVEQSNLPLPLTTQTQTTLPAQPNVESTSTETSQQIPPVTPTLITPDVNNKSEPTLISSASTTAPPTLGNESTLMRQSLNQEQKIAPNSPTVVPTPETLTPVEQSNLPLPLTVEAQPQPSILDLSNNVTAQTQTTQPSQPSRHKPTAETSQQIPPVTPTVITPDVNNKSEPTPVPGVLTTTPPILGNESTVMRQFLNAEQGIGSDASVGASDVLNNVTAQTQITQPFQPSQHKPTAETSQQILPVTPTAIPDVSTTTLSTLGDESTVVEQDLIGDFPNESSPKNPTFDNLLAPTGFATGGQVVTTQVQGSQSIAPSDTVAAMLTPGEFVINAQDTQKNLTLLEHINSGGRPENFISPKEIPNSQDEEKSALASDHSIHTNYYNQTLIQRESLDATSPTTSHALISSSIGQEIVEKQNLSRSTFIQAYTKENTRTKVGKHSEQYSLPNLVFQQSTPATNSPSETAPSQWSSVEELLSGSTNQSTAFDSEPVKYSRKNLKVPTVSKSPKTTIRRKAVLQGFANGGEVSPREEITSSNGAVPSDIDTEAQPITQTIKSFFCSPPTEDKIADDIETLAREIYNRLRQRLEIERERHGNGIYSGRLPW
ncbi:hypothetical protein [Brasilonema sennae]|nr:hypothetical protein [Brasilonema sennae]